MALFNLDQDPGEKIDLAAEEAERAAALRSMLLEWMDGFQWTFDAEVCDPDAERERLEAMKSMGYL